MEEFVVVAVAAVVAEDSFAYKIVEEGRYSMNEQKKRILAVAGDFSEV